jgi:hypothetical protein
MYSLYDDRVGNKQPETGLMPVSTRNRVNYFREFDDTNVIYSGVEPGKSAADGHYGKPANVVQKIEYSTDVTGSN